MGADRHGRQWALMAKLMGAVLVPDCQRGIPGKGAPASEKNMRCRYFFKGTLAGLCQELDVLGQQIGFGLRVLLCAPTDHLYPDFRRRHKVYSKMWTESPPEGTLERRTETYLISS